jgi:hypothetical protein
LHIDADSFVVTVDGCPVRGFTSHARAAHRGEDWGDDLVARVSRAAIVDLSTQCGLEVAPTPVVEALQAL